MRADSYCPGRGVTLFEALLVVFCFLVIIALVVPNLMWKGDASLVRDATQLTQIHRVMVIFSRQFNGTWPRPGVINTIGNEPGVGLEDHSLNTTANLFSALVAQNFLTPQICISPSEPNPVIAVHQTYNPDAYSPMNDVYWDSTFDADLELGSNVSYAHLPLHGARGRELWRDTGDPDFALLGNRGPKDGKHDPSSLTYRIHGNAQAWRGNILFADGSVELCETFTPRLPRDDSVPDNIFADQDGSDMFLTFTKSLSNAAPVWQFD